MIQIQKFSGIYQLKSEQIIQGNMDEVWEFFSKPQNLNLLTPNDMNFEITSGEPTRMYEGQIICYKVEIFKGIKQNWVTEIRSVVDRKRFVDEQRSGPYTIWHHEHHFEEIGNNQVRMNDIVTYKLPFGWLGNLVAGSMIQNRVKQIFRFREDAVNEKFKSS